MATQEVIFAQVKIPSDRGDRAPDQQSAEACENLDAHISLRPQCFEDYPGQEQVTGHLQIYTRAALMRGDMLDHCLLHGPPGLGKTTLAGIIARSLGARLKMTSGAAIDKSADLVGLLANLEPRSVLFIDEIHRLPSHVEEVLYSAMEDRSLDILIGQGPSARCVKLDLPPFTLIGATTRAGRLSAPLRDRFGIVEHLEYYQVPALTKILLRSAHIMGTPLTQEGGEALAKRSRGTPRVANVLLRRILDFALVAHHPSVGEPLVLEALGHLGIDPEGLSPRDRAFLRILQDHYEGGPAGLDALAASLNEERSTLEDVYEPYLVYRGFVTRTPRGRVLSETGRIHLESFHGSPAHS